MWCCDASKFTEHENHQTSNLNMKYSVEHNKRHAQITGRHSQPIGNDNKKRYAPRCQLLLYQIKAVKEPPSPLQTTVSYGIVFVCRSFRSLKPNSSSQVFAGRADHVFPVDGRLELVHHLPNRRPLGAIASCSLDNLHRDQCAILGVNRLCYGCQTITVLHYGTAVVNYTTTTGANAAPSLGVEGSAAAPDDAPPPTSLLAPPTLSPPSMTACPRACCVCLEWCFLRLVVVLCVCVFFPIYSGRQNRWKYQPGSHRISHPPSFCGGACLNFSREKDSAICFPRLP